VFGRRTTSSDVIATSVQKPNSTHETDAGYSLRNINKIKDITERFNLAIFFRQTQDLEELTTNSNLDKGVSYTLYIAESKRHESSSYKALHPIEGCSPTFFHLSLLCATRWFKYDRDYLCVNKSQFVPVIFQPPCTFFQSHTFMLFISYKT
jgi:hypothetical protein